MSFLKQEASIIILYLKSNNKFNFSISFYLFTAPSQSSHSAPAMKKKSKNKERQEKRLKKNKLSSSRLHKEKVDNPGSASPEMGAEDSNVEVVLDHEPTLPSDFSSHEYVQ